MNYLSLLCLGFIQVFFVAVNTYFIAKEFYLGIIIAAFAINIVWTFNVKRVVFGNRLHRIVYSLGATIGCVCGVYVSSVIKAML